MPLTVAGVKISIAKCAFMLFVASCIVWAAISASRGTRVPEQGIVTPCPKAKATVRPSETVSNTNKQVHSGRDHKSVTKVSKVLQTADKSAQTTRDNFGAVEVACQTDAPMRQTLHMQVDALISKCRRVSEQLESITSSRDDKPDGFGGIVNLASDLEIKLATLRDFVSLHHLSMLSAFESVDARLDDFDVGPILATVDSALSKSQSTLNLLDSFVGSYTGWAEKNSSILMMQNEPAELTEEPTKLPGTVYMAATTGINVDNVDALSTSESLSVEHGSLESTLDVTATRRQTLARTMSAAMQSRDMLWAEVQANAYLLIDANLSEIDEMLLLSTILSNETSSYASQAENYSIAGHEDQNGRIAQLDIELEQRVRELALARARNDTLAAIIAEFDTRSMGMTHDMAAANIQISQLTLQRETLSRKLNIAAAALDAAQKTKIDLQAKIDLKSAEKETLVSTCTEQDRELCAKAADALALNEEIVDLHGKLALSEEQSAQLVRDIASLRDRVQERDRELSEATSAQDELVSRHSLEISRVSSALQAQVALTARKGSKISEMAAAISDLEASQRARLEELHSLARKNESQEAELEARKRDISSLTLTLEMTSESVALLEAQLESANRKCTSAQADVATKCMESAALTRDLSIAREESRRIIEELTSLRGELEVSSASHTKIVADMRREIAQAKEDKQKQSLAVQELKGRLQAESSVIEAQRAELISKQAELVALDARCNELTKIKAANDGAILEKDANLESLTGQLELSKQQLMALQQNAADLQSRLDAEAEKCLQSDAQNVQTCADNTELQSLLQARQDELLAQQALVGELQASLSSEERAKAKLSDAVTSKDKEIYELQQKQSLQIATLRRQLEESAETVKQLNATTSQQNEVIAGLQGHQVTLVADNDKLTSKILALNVELDGMASHISDLDGIVASIRRHVEERQERIVLLEQQCSVKDELCSVNVAEIARLTLDNSRHNELIGKLTQEKDRLEGSLSEATGRVLAIESNMRNVDEQLGAAKSSLLSQTAQFEQLAIQLQEAKAECTRKDATNSEQCKSLEAIALERDAANENVRSLLAKIEQLTQQKFELSNDMGQMAIELADAHKQSESVRESADRRLDEIQAGLSEKVRLLDESAGRITLLESDIVGLRASLARANGELQSLRSSAQFIEDEKLAIKSTLEEEISKLTGLQLRHAELEQTLLTKTAECSAAESAMSDACARNTKLLASLDEARHEIAASQQRIQELEESHTSASREHALILEETQNAAREAERHRHELAEKLQSSDLARREIHGLYTDVSGKHECSVKENEDLKAQLAINAKAMSQQLSELEAFKLKNTELSAEIENLGSALGEQRQISQQLQSSSKAKDQQLHDHSTQLGAMTAELALLQHERSILQKQMERSVAFLQTLVDSSVALATSRCGPKIALQRAFAEFAAKVSAIEKTMELPEFSSGVLQRSLHEIKQTFAAASATLQEAIQQSSSASANHDTPKSPKVEESGASSEYSPSRRTESAQVAELAQIRSYVRDISRKADDHIAEIGVLKMRIAELEARNNVLEKAAAASTSQNERPSSQVVQDEGSGTDMTAIPNVLDQMYGALSKL